MNNPEVRDEQYIQSSKEISQEVREKIVNDMVLACEVAAGMHDHEGENPEGTIYALQGNAFMLAKNPNDLNDVHVYIADLGFDVMRRDKEKHDPHLTVKDNIRSAASFYAWMTGEAFQLPSEHPLSSEMNEELLEDGFVLVEYRGYPQ